MRCSHQLPYEVCCGRCVAEAMEREKRRPDTTNARMTDSTWPENRRTRPANTADPKTDRR